MPTKKSRLLCSLLALLSAVLFLSAVALRAGADTAAVSPADKRIVAVIPPDSPPTYFLDKQTGKAAGFAVDVMNTIAERAGLQVAYIFEDGWSDIIEMVKDGKADLAPGMGVSKDREKVLAFTSLIDAFPISFFVRTEHKGLDATLGIHRVGAIQGSVSYELLKKRTDIRLVIFESYYSGLFEVLSGKIDAFACPAPTLWQLARDSGVEERIKVVDKPIAEIRRAIAMRKNDAELLMRINNAVEGFVGTPAYQQVYTKWYGKPVPYWSERRIITTGGVIVVVIILLMAGWRYLSLLRLNRKLSAAIVDRDEAVSAAMRNKERLESLVKIAQNRTENTQELLDFALEEAIRLTRSKIGYIYFYNEEKKEFTLNTWSREVMKECTISERKTIYQLDQTGIWGEAVRQRKPIMLQDFHAPHPLKKGYPEGHTPLSSFLTVPVFQQGRIVAVVGVANKQTAFDQDDITQLTLLMDAVWRMVEHKKIETALRENEAVLRSFLNAITESALLMDREGRVLAANETAAQRLGTPGRGIVGSNLYDLLPPDVGERRKVHLDAVFRTGVPDRFEDERLGKVIDSSVYPVLDPTGAVSAIAIIGIDITERKQAVSALEFSEKKYRMLYDSAIDAIFIIDMNGTFIDINRTASDRLGYAREELLALKVSQLDHADFAALVGNRITQLQQQGQLIFESAHRRKDGSAMPVEINARIIDYDGKKAIFSIVRDITDRKLAEQEREKLIAERQKALADIKTLHGILPICASCKKIRDDSGAWHQIESFIRDHSDAEFSHGLCTDCAQKLYPEYLNRKK